MDGKTLAQNIFYLLTHFKGVVKFVPYLNGDEPLKTTLYTITNFSTIVYLQVMMFPHPLED